MKILIQPNTTRAELGAIVCNALASVLGDSPVLVGGAAASIYSKGRYKSEDLDIVSYRTQKITPLMRSLGFVAKGAHWHHPDTDLTIQFVSPPTMIGNKHVRKPPRMRTKAGNFSIISAVDSACDRLSWYLNGDKQGLKQCADIVLAQRIPLSRIRTWLQKEPYSKEQQETALKELRRVVKNLRGGRKRLRRKQKYRTHSRRNP